MRGSSFLVMAAAVGAVFAISGPDDASGTNGNANVTLRHSADVTLNRSDTITWNDTLAETETLSIGAKTVGSWPLTFRQADHDHRLTVPVHLGTPPQRFELDVHTSSASTWVMCNETLISSFLMFRNNFFFVPKDNSTLVRNNAFMSFTPELMHGHRAGSPKQFQLRYRTLDKYAARGLSYHDRVQIGDGKDAIDYGNQTFAHVRHINSYLVDDPNFAGVLGLGGRHDWGDSHGTPDGLLSALNTSEPLRDWKFSMTFKEKGGHMDWGWRNESRYTGALVRANWSREKTPYWAKPFHIFNISLWEPGKHGPPQTLSAAIDSASSYIVLPAAMAEAYYTSLGADAQRRSLTAPGEQGWQFPCSWKLPDLTLQLANSTTRGGGGGEEEGVGGQQVARNFTIPGENLRLQKRGPMGDVVCFGAIVATRPRTRLGQNRWRVTQWKSAASWKVGPYKVLPNTPKVILGWPFLKNKFVEMDRINGISIGDAA